MPPATVDLVRILGLSFTLLEFTAKNGQLEVVEAPLSFGADVNIQTPCLWAASNGHIKVIDDEFTDIDDSVGVSNAVWVILILVCPHGQFLIKLTRRPRVYSRGQNQWTKNLIFPYRLLWIKVPSASWLKLKTNNP
jgi:hypothetical protein